jgi:citrate synthase
MPIEGQLIYRGIDINKIIEGFSREGRFGFEETIYLLLFGKLPNTSQLNLIQQILNEYRKLPKGFVRDTIMKSPGKDVMNTLSRSVLALYSFDKNPDDTSLENVLRQSLFLISNFSLIAVYSYAALLYYFKNKSLIIHKPLKGLSIAENILHMLRPDNRYTDLEATLLDITLVLHAEHGGGNNSTFTNHVVSSSGTDTYSAMASSLCSLKGPKHGGANIKVSQMMENIKQNVVDWRDDEEVIVYLGKILSKQAFDKLGLIYGVGHAVYSLSDPRAVILKKYAKKLAEEKGLKDEFDLYAKIEGLAPRVIAKHRKIYKGVSVNVDFYSGLVYKMLNIPPELFTPLFAVSRIVGWSAHRMEEIVNKGKIIRPAYKSVTTEQKYIALNDRL